jgi:hypothetical protein
MTDARSSREHAEALVAPTPADQVSREHVEALVGTTPTDRLSREHVEAMVLPRPNLLASREHVEVLIRVAPAVTPAGARTVPVKIKHPDGLWYALKAMAQ